MKHFLDSVLCTCVTVFYAHAQRRSVTNVPKVMDITIGQRSIVKEFPFLIEAPNQIPNGNWLVYNSGGKPYKLFPESPEEPQLIDSDHAARYNNDRVISADGKQTTTNSGTKEDGRSRIYTPPFEGGVPRLITPPGPSCLYGWNPDGKQLAYCAEKGGSFDVCVIPALGGKEERLTAAEGLDDGPEYLPYGQCVWFNSTRTGLTQAWCMKADGSGRIQMAFDRTRNSQSPRISPDEKQVIFIAYTKDGLEPEQHLVNRNVELRLIPAEGRGPKTLVKLSGGQGTISVNPWVSDSRRFAPISYRLN